MSPKDRLSDPVLRLSFQLNGWLLAGFAVLVSTLITLGGEERWRGEPFQIAMQLPGAPETWGWSLGTFGITLSAGFLLEYTRFKECSRMLVGAGATFCGLWCFSLGTTFLCQLLIDGTQVSNLGFVIWFFIGIWYLLRACVNLKILQL